MDKEILRKIGLTDSEIEVYIDLVKHNESLASETAPRVKISRTYVYDAIQSLISKGLVVYVIKNSRRYFKALEAGKLLDYLDERKKQMEKQKQDVLGLIKELKSFQKPLLEKPQVEVFEGPEGLKTIFNDILKEKEAVGWGTSDRVRKYLPEWYIERYLKEKERKGIKTRQLYTEGETPLYGKGYTNKKISKDYSSPVTFAAYGSKISIFFWSETPVIIRIVNQDIANSFKKHFEFLWKKVK